MGQGPRSFRLAPICTGGAASDHADRFLHGPAVRPVHQARARRAVPRVLAAERAVPPGSAGGARRCCSAVITSLLYMWRGPDSLLSVGVGNAVLLAVFCLLLAGRARLRSASAAVEPVAADAAAVACRLSRSGFSGQRLVPGHSLVRLDCAAARDGGVRVLARPCREIALALAGHRDLRLLCTVLCRPHSAGRRRAVSVRRAADAGRLARRLQSGDVRPHHPAVGAAGVAVQGAPRARPAHQGADRSADRRAQPPRLHVARRSGCCSATPKSARRSACCSSISTTSNRSTTASAIPAATTC